MLDGVEVPHEVLLFYHHGKKLLAGVVVGLWGEREKGIKSYNVVTCKPLVCVYVCVGWEKGCIITFLAEL